MNTRLPMNRTLSWMAVCSVVWCIALIVGVRGADVPAASAVPAAPAAIPEGEWRAFANGDDVLALAMEGTVLWAGTRAGGLVRWDTTSGSYDQFLRPQDPLGGNTVNDIAVAEDGRKWLATDGGLSVFDDGGTPGRQDDQWRTYTVEGSYKGLPSDDVRAVAVHGDLVWVGGVQVKDPESGEWRGGGLGRLDTKGTVATDDDTWAAVADFEGTRKTAPDGTTQLGMVSDNVNDIVLLPNGSLWIATSPHWKLEQMASPTEPRTWIRVHGGLSYLDTKGTATRDDDTWRAMSCETSQFTVKCPVWSLGLDRYGWVWAGVGGRGAIAFVGDQGSFTDERWRIYNPHNGTQSAFIQSIAFGPEESPELVNTVWMATRSHGVSVVDHKGTLRNQNDDEWQLGRGVPFTRSDGLARDRAQAVVLGEGKAWIGTGPEYGVAGGISPLDLVNRTFDKALVTTNAPPTNFVTDLDFGEEGSRWEGHVWIATGSRSEKMFGAGAVDLDTKGTRDTTDDAWERYTTRSTDADDEKPWTGLRGDNVHAVRVDGDVVWLGSVERLWNPEERVHDDGGVSVFDGSNWTARSVENTGGEDAGLRFGSVSCLELGCDGELWIGTGTQWDRIGKGVDVLTPGASVHVRTQDAWQGYGYSELASDNTSEIVADCESGQVWVAADHHVTLPSGGSPGGAWVGGGVAVYDIDAGTWERYDTSNGLESYNSDSISAVARSVAVGQEGRAYVGTYGTRDTSEAEIVETEPFWTAALNMWDGSEWTAQLFERAGWVSGIAEDEDGRIWVGTSRGGAARDSDRPETWRVDRIDGGLYVFDGSQWQTLEVGSTGLPSNDISLVKIAPSGDVWIGTEGWGMARFDPGGAVPTPTATTDAPAPTPTFTPTITPTSTIGPTKTPTATPSASATWPKPTAGSGGKLYVPWTYVRH